MRSRLLSLRTLHLRTASLDPRQSTQSTPQKGIAGIRGVSSRLFKRLFTLLLLSESLEGGIDSGIHPRGKESPFMKVHLFAYACVDMSKFSV